MSQGVQVQGRFAAAPSSRMWQGAAVQLHVLQLPLQAQEQFEAPRVQDSSPLDATCLAFILLLMFRLFLIFLGGVQDF